MRYGGLKKFYSGVRLYLNPTNRCNLNCSHCSWRLFGLGMLKKSKTEKTLDEWKTFFSDFPLKIKEVIFVGGEPCLYPDITELAEWLINEKIFVTIYTNLYTDRLSVLKKNVRLRVIATYHGCFMESFFWFYYKRLQCRKEFMRIGKTKKFHILSDIERSFNGIAVGPDHLMFASYRQYIEHYNKEFVK